MNISPGIYRARAAGITSPDSVRWGVADSGNQQIAVRFVLLNEHDEETPDAIWWVGTFSDKANEKGTTATQITLKALRNCGWRGGDLDNLAGLDSEVVELDVQEDTYEGKVRTKVRWVNRPGDGFAFKREMGVSDIKALSQKVKGTLLNMDRKNPPPPVKARGTAAPTGTDDIPF